MAAFATSYIKTEGSTVTRNADVASMTGTNFSSWFNENESTFFTQASATNLASSGGVFKMILEGGRASNDYSFFSMNFLNDRLDFDNRSAVTNTANNIRGATGLTSNTFVKGVLAFSNTQTAAAQNGTLGTAFSGAAQRLPIDRIFIGSRTGTAIFLNGHIQRIAYYPTRLSNAQLQALTR